VIQISKKLIYCVVVLILGFGCTEGTKVATIYEGGGAAGVVIFNCTVYDSLAGGRVFHIFARTGPNPWADLGVINPVEVAWTDCHDAAHTGKAVKVDFGGVEEGTAWRICAMKVHRDTDGSFCDSSLPDIANHCPDSKYDYHTDKSAPWAMIDLKEGE
jgi:hypothetical protein